MSYIHVTCIYSHLTTFIFSRLFPLQEMHTASGARTHTVFPHESSSHSTVSVSLGLSEMKYDSHDMFGLTLAFFYSTI